MIQFDLPNEQTSAEVYSSTLDVLDSSSDQLSGIIVLDAVERVAVFQGKCSDLFLNTACSRVIIKS